MAKRPISVTEFEDRTSLVVDAIMGKVFEAPIAEDLTPEDKRWFTEHISWRVRWLYTNMPGWDQVLALPDAREVLYGFIESWLEIYVVDPESYRWVHVPDPRFFDPEQEET